MNIIPIIKIAAVVGLSAVKLVSTVMQMKERRQGLINPVYQNNCSNPYVQPMYNNNNCYTQPVSQPIFESRRSVYVAPQPQPVPVPVPTPVPVTPVPTTPVPPMPMMQTPVSDMSMLTRPVQPFASYRRGFQQPMMYNNNYTSCAATAPVWQQPNYAYQAPQQSSYNIDDEWCSKSIGQMREEQMMHQRMMQQQQQQRMMQQRMMQQQPPPQPPNYWGGRRFDTGGQQKPNDIVAMFYTDDGKPLFGPPPNTTSRSCGFGFDCI